MAGWNVSQEAVNEMKKLSTELQECKEAFSGIVTRLNGTADELSGGLGQHVSSIKALIDELQTDCSKSDAQLMKLTLKLSKAAAIREAHINNDRYKGMSSGTSGSDGGADAYGNGRSGGGSSQGSSKGSGSGAGSSSSAIAGKSNYSQKVNSYMRSEAELEIYQKAGLSEQEVGGKTALIRNDIDWDKVDEKGRSNRERVDRGLAPLDSNGDSIELHHVGQKVDSPLAELTFEEHRGKGNDTILHDKTIQSETHGEGNNWDSERQDYWVSRSEFIKKG